MGPGFMEETCWTCNGNKSIEIKNIQSEKLENTLEKKEIDNLESINEKEIIEKTEITQQKPKRKYTKRISAGIK